MDTSSTHGPADPADPAGPAGPPAVSDDVPQHERPHRFRHWRRTRPFWGGLVMLLGGAEILLTVWAPLPVVLHVGFQGSLGYLVPIIIMCGAVLVVFTPAQRIFLACVTALLGLASWLTSNLGGFILGMVLTLIGSVMAYAWKPRHAAGPSPDTAEPAGIQQPNSPPYRA
jgi:hypothetical protein